MAFDFLETLKQLKSERYRTLILHAKPQFGPSMTEFVQKATHKSNGTYVDLLLYFIDHPDLSAEIDTFGLEKLVVLLKELSAGSDLLIVDRPDFLLDTWRSRELKNFYQLCINQWDGYKDSMKASLVFCLQTSLELESEKIMDSRGKTRIFNLSDFNQII